jgi:hypothetical protein
MADDIYNTSSAFRKALPLSIPSAGRLAWTIIKLRENNELVKLGFRMYHSPVSHLLVFSDTNHIIE